MSNIYILEPPTSGKILMKTTVGDIDIELWTKETPKTCRNFIQLCLEGYYDNLIFHRVVQDFIVQGGDPNGDGTGGECIYGQPFKDEFHQRLRFTRRGLLAMANGGKDDNGSQFFFTMGPCPELRDKHTIFGKVTGNTVYNMMKLQEGLVEDERPVYPHKIIKIEVLNNPFLDIVPREIKVQVKDKEKKKEKKPGVKNFKLLSFGDQAEEDEEESKRENQKFGVKGKSTHDILDDPKFSAETEVIERQAVEVESDHEHQLESIRKKLKGVKRTIPPKISKDQNDDDEWNYGEDVETEKRRKVEALKNEIKSIKKEYQANKLKAKSADTKKINEDEKRQTSIKEYKDEFDKYTDKKNSLLKKGSEREKFTLDLLEKFKKRLHEAKEQNEKNKTEEITEDVKEDEGEIWLKHELRFEDSNPVLAKDANTKDDDWFEIYDPRNPLNKRRRGENTSKDKK